MAGLNLVTPEKFYELQQSNPQTKDSMTLEYIRDLAQQPPAKCSCGAPVWKLGQTGLCFTCTTGESDASADYELIQS